jgi:hypothetical protein
MRQFYWRPQVDQFYSVSIDWGKSSLTTLSIFEKPKNLRAFSEKCDADDLHTGTEIHAFRPHVEKATMPFVIRTF